MLQKDRHPLLVDSVLFGLVERTPAEHAAFGRKAEEAEAEREYFDV